MNVIKIGAHLVWRVYRPANENDRWVGVCDVLRLTVEGVDVGDLADSIEDTLNGLFADLLEEGDLPRFLLNRGWQLQTPLPARQTPDTRFEVPYDIVVRPASDFQAAVC